VDKLLLPPIFLSAVATLLVVTFTWVLLLVV
jgi:hypothetical protein